MNQEIITTEDRRSAQHLMLRPIVDVKQILETEKVINKFIVEALEKDVDYGTIPGTTKKDKDGNEIANHTLLKPGAEKLCKSFAVTAEFEIVEKEVDHEREVKWRKKYWNKKDKRYEHTEGESQGFYQYTIRCLLRGPHGQIIGTSLGLCSTMESKYVDRPRDCQNTVLKMAQKRAHVGAVLLAFGLSSRFTQDLEDEEDVKDETHTGNKAAAEKSGFNPNIKAHVAMVMKQLERLHLDLNQEELKELFEKLEGKPSTDLEAVLKDMSF